MILFYYYLILVDKLSTKTQALIKVKLNYLLKKKYYIAIPF